MKPNVLFLLIDCLRADHLDGRAGAARIPTLSRLAAEGWHFTQTIAAATTTTPAVASLFTGHYSPRHGVRSLKGYRLRTGLPTLAEGLAAGGWHTRAEVTGPMLPAVGLDRGFQVYRHRDQYDYLDGPWGGELERLLAPGAMPAPWFLFVHLWELHVPRRVRAGFESARFGSTPYARALSSLDARLATLLERLGADTVVIVHGDHGEQLPASKRVQRWWRWRQRLSGGVFPPWSSFPRREGHGFDVWEPLVRVPFVVHGPGAGIAPSRRIDQLTRQVDIAPTVLELAGLPPPADIEGRSLVPAAREGRPLDLTAYVEACGESLVDPRDWRRGLRTARWKYVETAGSTGPPQLYDLVADPHERRNVAAEHPAETARLRDDLAARLRAWESDGEGESRLSAEDEELVAEKLRDLGYIE